MRQIFELGLDVINNNAEILLVDKNCRGRIGLNYNTVSNRVEKLERNYEIGSFEEMSFVKIIASTKQYDNIPKLIINDYVKDLAYDTVMNYLTDGNPDGDFKRSTIGADDYKTWFEVGYKKANNIYKYTEEDLKLALSEAFKASQEGYNITTDEIINMLNDRKLWVESCEDSFRIRKNEDGDYEPYDETYMVSVRDNKLNAYWK